MGAQVRAIALRKTVIHASASPFSSHLPFTFPPVRLHGALCRCHFGQGKYVLAEDVEQELMELWSNVEKEKAAHQELLARRLARQSSHPGGSAVGVLGTHGPIAAAPIASTGLAHETELLNGVRGGAARGGCAAGLLGIKGQTADALKISIESAYEAVPLRDVSADTAAAAGEVSTHLHGTSCEEIHAAQPAPQLRSAQLAGHGMGMSHSRSSSGAEDVEQPHIRGNDVESHRLESRHDPVKGSPDVHALGSRSKRPRLHHSKGKLLSRTVFL